MSFVYRSDMHRIQISVDGVTTPAGFLFDTFEGGGGTSDNTYYHAGGMAPASPTGGLFTPADITATVAWRDDTYPLFIQFWNAARINADFTAGITPLNRNRTSSVNPLTWTGILLSAAQPEANAADSTTGYMTLTFAPNDALTN